MCLAFCPVVPFPIPCVCEMLDAEIEIVPIPWECSISVTFFVPPVAPAAYVVDSDVPAASKNLP